MLETVKVIQTVGTTAKVVMERGALCGDCGKCMVGRKNLTVTAVVKNEIGAKVGDSVLAEMTLGGVLSASAIMYGVPLVFFLIGCFIGYSFVGNFIGINENIASVLTAFVLLALSYIPIKILDKNGKFKERYTIVLKEITESAAK